MNGSLTAGGAPMVSCRWCGLYHGQVCPYVRAIEFHADGVTVKRVEFHGPKDAEVRASATFKQMMWEDYV